MITEIKCGDTLTLRIYNHTCRYAHQESHQESHAVSELMATNDSALVHILTGKMLLVVAVVQFLVGDRD